MFLEVDKMTVAVLMNSYWFTFACPEWKYRLWLIHIFIQIVIVYLQSQDCPKCRCDFSTGREIQISVNKNYTSAFVS